MSELKLLKVCLWGRRVSAPLLLLGVFAATSWSDDGVEFFERSVRPLLARHCYSCHGAKKAEAGLRLDLPSGVSKGGLSGPAIIAGKPDDSLLIQVIRRQGDLQMPPEQSLTADEVGVFVDWVSRGATWPAADKNVRIQGDQVTAEDLSFWSFQPVRSPVVPAVKDSQWCSSPVDRFLLAKIESAGLAPARRASKRALLRRAKFDLVGLPPLPEEVIAFLEDPAPDAFAQVVDRLLASPGHGERWARHWLDAVRYCDSRDARHTGQPYDVNEAWRYRDWVVDSLNRDRDYDEFVRQQIAGDYAPISPAEEDVIEGLIASGMLVIGEWGSGDADAEKMYTDIIDDQIHLVTQTFMGISLSCARCHDHKFDPFSTRDYYGMSGIFFSTQVATPGTDAVLMRRPLLSKAAVKERQELQAKLSQWELELQQFDETERSKVRERVVDQLAKYLVGLWEFQQRDPTPLLGEFCQEANLEPALFSAWRAFEERLRDPGELLTQLVVETDAAGVFTWKSSHSQPLFHINTNDHPVRVPGEIPPRSIAVHPTPTTGVALAWRSPFVGQIQIRGQVSDADKTGGNGVEWVVELDRGDRPRCLSSGGIERGGTALLAGDGALNEVAVRVGDVVRLIVLPKARDYVCDLTHLQLNIQEVGGRNRIWSPELDIIPTPKQGNPHADASGNPAVWRFLHMSRRHDLHSIAGDELTILDRWLAALREPDREEVTVAAEEIQLLVTAAIHQEDIPVDRGQVEFAHWLTVVGGFLQDQTSLLRNEASQLQRDKLSQAIQAGRKQLQTTQLALAAQEGGVPTTVHAGFQDARVHIRGQYNRLGEVVRRGVPEILAGDEPFTIQQGSGRIELARWVTNVKHPLTPRVMVNRIWLHHFGDGIVRTPGDFGRQGQRPTHPLLLDWLAARFVESGWSLKAMHRQMMSSSAYQQSIRRRDIEELRQEAATSLSPKRFTSPSLDPDNRLLARMPSLRLEAEAILDALLSFSGQLDRRFGGPAVPRYPQGYSRAEKNVTNFSSRRRALYLMTIRGEYRDGPFVLDAANPNRLVHQRTVSTTAPQALLLMNDPYFVSLAEALAERVRSLSPASSRDRITWLYELLYSRPPERREMHSGLEFLSTFQAETQAWQQYCHALMCTNELIYRN